MRTECETLSNIYGGYSWKKNHKCVPWSPEQNGTIIGSGNNTGYAGVVKMYSRLYLNVNFVRDGNVTFKFRVDSEPGFDGMSFQIDYDQWLTEVTTDHEWKEYTFAVSRGSHQLQWVYAKDNIGDVGEDRAWLQIIELYGTKFADYECTSCAISDASLGRRRRASSSEGGLPQEASVHAACLQCLEDEYADDSSLSDYKCVECPQGRYSHPGSVGVAACIVRQACIEADMFDVTTPCQRVHSTASSSSSSHPGGEFVMYSRKQWRLPHVCNASLPGGLALEHFGLRNISCPLCPPGSFRPTGRLFDGSCAQCPLGQVVLPAARLPSDQDLRFSNSCEHCPSGQFTIKSRAIGPRGEWWDTSDSGTGSMKQQQAGGGAADATGLPYQLPGGFDTAAAVRSGWENMGSFLASPSAPETAEGGVGGDIDALLKLQVDLVAEGSVRLEYEITHLVPSDAVRTSNADATAWLFFAVDAQLVVLQHGDEPGMHTESSPLAAGHHDLVWWWRRRNLPVGASAYVKIHSVEIVGVRAPPAPAPPLSAPSWLAGGVSCAVCPAGNHPSMSQDECVQCPEGSFVDALLAIGSCVACPKDTFSVAGASRCTHCGANTFAEERSGECTGVPKTGVLSFFQSPLLGPGVHAVPALPLTMAWGEGLSLELQRKFKFHQHANGTFSHVTPTTKAGGRRTATAVAEGGSAGGAGAGTNAKPKGSAFDAFVHDSGLVLAAVERVEMKKLGEVTSGIPAGQNERPTQHVFAFNMSVWAALVPEGAMVEVKEAEEAGMNQGRDRGSDRKYFIGVLSPGVPSLAPGAAWFQKTAAPDTSAASFLSSPPPSLGAMGFEHRDNLSTVATDSARGSGVQFSGGGSSTVGSVSPLTCLPPPTYAVDGLGSFLSIHPSLPLGSGITLLYAKPPVISDDNSAARSAGAVPANVITSVSLVCDLDAGAASLDAGSIESYGASFERWVDSFDGGGAMGMSMLSGIALGDGRADWLLAGAGAHGSGEGAGVGQPVRVLGMASRAEVLGGIAGMAAINDSLGGQQSAVQQIEWRSALACPICQSSFFEARRSECKDGWQRVQHIRSASCLPTRLIIAPHAHSMQPLPMQHPSPCTYTLPM
jgi:hypothetical protein